MAESVENDEFTVAAAIITADIAAKYNAKCSLQ